MNPALIYLLRSKLKNNVISVLRSPQKLIYAIFMTALLVFTTVVNSTRPAGYAPALRPISEFYAIIIAFFALMYLLVSSNGFGNGATLFKMSDVNLLFASPIRPRAVLFYGLFQQMGNSLILGLFIPFQYSWMNMSYGIQPATLLLLIALYSLTIFTAQLAAMGIYVYSHGDSRRSIGIGLVFYGVHAVYIAAILGTAFYSSRAGLPILPEILRVTELPTFRTMPLVEWGIGIAMLIAISVSDLDYYEDVLGVTALKHSERERIRESRGMFEKNNQAKVKRARVSGSDKLRGQGAKVFFYKHMLENRRSRLFILDSNSLIVCAVTLLIAYFMREEGYLAFVGSSAYLMIFSSALGRFVGELKKPYIYLIPEPPFRLLLWSMCESVPSATLEALIILVPLRYIMGLSVSAVAAAVIMRVSLALLMLAANLVIERLMGSVSVRALVMTLYMLTVVLMCVPGILLCVLTISNGLNIIDFETTVSLVFAAGNVPVTLLVVFLCRNIIEQPGG